MIKGYRPTECTVTRMRGDILSDNEVTIGKPVPGATVWILDEALEEASSGGIRRMCTGGIRVARVDLGKPKRKGENGADRIEEGDLLPV